MITTAMLIEIDAVDLLVRCFLRPLCTLHAPLLALSSLIILGFRLCYESLRMAARAFHATSPDNI